MSLRRLVAGAVAGVLLAAGFAFPAAAKPPGDVEPKSLYRQLVNLDHLNHLQDEVVLGGRKMAWLEFRSWWRARGLAGRG